MNSGPADGPRPDTGNGAWIAAIGATAVLGALALNGQSFWVDELGTWRLTIADSWRDWFLQLVNWPYSDSQIPLYHLYMRAWTRVFPSTEVWIRASNLPWLLCSFQALLTTPAPPGQRRLVWLIGLVVLVHPMVWYYVNEVRPYMMIFAGASIAMSGLLARLMNRGEPAAAEISNSRLLVGTALMSATSILGIFWSMAFILPAAWDGLRRGARSLMLTRRNAVTAAVCAAALVPVFCLYAFTIVRGVYASRLFPNSAQSFAFGLYEVAGFSGVGPGRIDLRAIGAAALPQYAVPIALFGFATGVALLAGLLNGWRRWGRDLLVVLAAVALTLALLFAVGTAKHWRVLGRHMMPLVLFDATLIALGIEVLLRRCASLAARVAMPLAGVAALVALLVSSVEVADAPRHQREDFRGAVQKASAIVREGGGVWWVAVSYGPDFYGLPLTALGRCGDGGAAAAVLFQGPALDELERCAEPRLIVVGRSEASDQAGAVARYAAEHGFRDAGDVRGFEMLVRPPAAGAAN